MVKTEELNIQTKGNCDIVNITDDITAVLGRTSAGDGIVTLFNVGSTAGITRIDFDRRPLTRTVICQITEG